MARGPRVFVCGRADAEHIAAEANPAHALAEVALWRGVASRHVKVPPRAQDKTMVGMFEHVAASQAETILAQRADYQRVVRERDAAKADVEAAYDLAEQYAVKAGISIGPDDVLRYVREYWTLRGQFEASWHKYQLFHWDILCLDLQLERLRPAEWTVERLVAQVRRHIAAVNPVGGVREKVEAWARPAAPEQLSLEAGRD